MRYVFLFLTLISFLFSENLITLKKYNKNSFSPIKNEKFNIYFTLNKPAKVILKIYTPDGNEIKRIEKKFKKGEHYIVWDGKDKWGEIVPDEAYMVSIEAIDNKNSQTLSFENTGGEILKDLNAKYDRFGNIYYKLSKPARVLIRAGILNGPMLSVISNWVPKDKGYIRQHWDLKDKDGVVNFSTIPFVISVSAFALPDFSIITYGNNKIDYLTYYKNHNFKCNKKPSNFKPQINGKNISYHYYLCRIDDVDPKVNIKIPSIVQNDKRVRIKVLMDKKDEKEFNSIKYEVSFFVDFKFVSEEEMGYVPLTWSYLPNGLSPGEHIMTVNITAFNGKVGVKNIKFKVQK